MIKINDNVQEYLEVLEILRKNGINQTMINFILDILIPKDDKGDYVIDRKVGHGIASTAAIFVPRTEMIKISMDKLYLWLAENGQDAADRVDASVDADLYSYLLLFMLSHEINHAYQYLISKEKIEHPSENVKNGYKLMFDTIILKYGKMDPRLINRIKRLISLRLYDSHHDEYVIERNANIEACNTMMSIALEDNDMKMYELFTGLRQEFMRIGYIKNCEGSFLETFSDIGLRKQFLDEYTNEGLKEIDNIRYGLPVREETRTLLLRGK